MYKTGFVVEVLPDGRARVRVAMSGCGGCGGCACASGCASPVITVPNPAGARAGDSVVIGAEGTSGSAALCLIPMLAFLAALCVTSGAGSTDAVAAIASVGSFLAGALAAFLIRRAMAAERRKNAAVIEVLT